MSRAGRDPELAKLDPYDTRIPDGEYSVAFDSEEPFWNHGRQVWGVVFRIVDDEHTGLPIFFFLNIPQLRQRRTPSARLSLAYEAATGRRAPARIAEVRPGSFLAEKLLVGQTRTVEIDIHGQARPLEHRYSVIDRLVPAPAPSSPCGVRK